MRTESPEERANVRAVVDHAMSQYLDSLESLIILICQRHMDDETLDRYARILNLGTNDAISRLHQKKD